MQQYVVGGVLQHATINEVLDEHEVAERRSIMFQAHGHAIILSITPSTLEVQEETSIMSRIMSDATDGVRNLHGYSEYPSNQLLNVGERSITRSGADRSRRSNEVLHEVKDD